MSLVDSRVFFVARMISSLFRLLERYLVLVWYSAALSGFKARARICWTQWYKTKQNAQTLLTMIVGVVLCGRRSRDNNSSWTRFVNYFLGWISTPASDHQWLTGIMPRELPKVSLLTGTEYALEDFPEALLFKTLWDVVLVTLLTLKNLSHKLMRVTWVINIGDNNIGSTIIGWR